ncbi:hypothetical protein ACVIHI_008741 [Bradyrhizobium sp. USDA 4524]|uniref:hypothetical protein n=1 Tax=unclassified Bradyrhizobium TaxID=2631580 RepID=UPI00209DB5BF|nr:MULTISPECIES: hypothetical protein [unclassified Bradyrhizobium]MCP1845795.1 hypothetical protein [Bradyrhizobium sp. USDA 4538]MCP1906882.1 hypothetical protein [Bradyrhizobium sp. USDA 4537]MCP1985357.1 hypothetical protein [Bradyrhizobium sp. USDA 4539]
MKSAVGLFPLDRSARVQLQEVLAAQRSIMFPARHIELVLQVAVLPAALSGDNEDLDFKWWTIASVLTGRTNGML